MACEFRNPIQQKQGMFRTWWQFGLFCMWTGAICGIAIVTISRLAAWLWK